MRCGLWYNRVNLSFQWEWRGPTLQNLYILVCKDCLDTPQEQLRAITLPADPVPVYFPSVEDFATAETDYRAISEPTVYDPITGLPIPSTTLRITENCENRTLLPFGVPVGMDADAVMPYNGAVQEAFGVPLSVLSVISNGTATVQVTCSAVHNLQTNDQVSIQGLSNRAACGSYSVTVLGATTFTYMTYGAINAASLLTPTTRIITCLVGLPYGYQQIPKIEGPNLYDIGSLVDVCYLSLEDGGNFLFENGFNVQLESCVQIVATCGVELEAANGVLLLENGLSYLELETCADVPVTTDYGFQFEATSDLLLQENDVYFIDQETAPD